MCNEWRDDEMDFQQPLATFICYFPCFYDIPYSASCIDLIIIYLDSNVITFPAHADPDFELLHQPNDRSTTHQRPHTSLLQEESIYTALVFAISECGIVHNKRPGIFPQWPTCRSQTNSPPHSFLHPTFSQPQTRHISALGVTAHAWCIRPPTQNGRDPHPSHSCRNDPCS